jgi:hypothetical protein
MKGGNASNAVVLCWHRTDLRLHDSPALHAALATPVHDAIIPSPPLRLAVNTPILAESSRGSHQKKEREEAKLICSNQLGGSASIPGHVYGNLSSAWSQI